ncbi:hypothetical protein E2E30_12975 [Sphingomonas sp. AAP5]|uniref:hypothetical protein n=1 Tax=Sphingomonas sp. AAP5 TaxID=1523415 RepID=UPI00105706F0|nr:hypothetical protein [Sphingomonas sp. AAP5]QBM76582.1 hypothetical protein E2E30_12975 [Sphingomonas sp. AAP5]
MEGEHFDINTDAARNLLRVTMRGHWTLDTVEAYKKAVLSAVSGMLAAGCRRGDVLAFVDARDLSAQSQDAVADYKASMDRDGLLPRRLATLVSSALFKRQVERIAIPNQRLFSDEASALAWLTSPDSEN